MKTRAGISILALLALTVFGAGSAMALAGQQHGADKPMQHGAGMMDMSGMMAEPHHVLAMAYMQNLGAFTHALHHQAETASPLDTDFARSAVDEIKRSFDEMEKHHGEHMKSMSPEMRTHMEAMMKEMGMHRAMLKDSVGALDRDVQSDHIDAKKVAADCAVILEHLDAMSKMHADKKPMKM